MVYGSRVTCNGFIWTLAFLLPIYLTLVTGARADEVYLKSGGKLTGTVTDLGDKIKVTTLKDFSATISKDQIERIVKVKVKAAPVTPKPKKSPPPKGRASRVCDFSGEVSEIGEEGKLLTLKVFRLKQKSTPKRPTTLLKVSLTEETALVYLGMKKGKGVIEPGLLVDGWLVPKSADVAARLEFSTKPLWPPQVGKTFPNLRLLDSKGRRVSFSSFKGKYVLVGISAMT